MNNNNNQSVSPKNVIRQLLRLLNKYSRIEKQPIALDNGIALTTKEIHTIQAIGDAKKIIVTDIGKHFGVTKGAASQMVSRLVAKGFVTKTVSQETNKEYLLSLTSLGKKAYEIHENMHGQDMDKLLSSLNEFSDKSLCDFISMISKLEDVMDKRLEE